jgi:hypothetical protein
MSVDCIRSRADSKRSKELTRKEPKVFFFRTYTFEIGFPFSSWAGEKWMFTRRQMDALTVEALRLGIPVQSERERRVPYSHWTSQPTWKYETINVRGKSQKRYRDIKTGRFIKKP